MIGGAGMHSSSLSQTCLPANVLIYNWEKRYGRVICSLSKRNTDCDTLKKIVGTAWSKWLDLSSQQVHEQLGIEQSGSVCRSLINTSSFCLSVQTIHSAILWLDHHWTFHHTYVEQKLGFCAMINKLASLEAMLVRNYDRPTYRLTYWQG